MLTVGIIGLGLIGGSMAIDLKKRKFAGTVLGVENNPVNASAAETIGLVDKVVALDICIADSDIIVLAVPVAASVSLLPVILDKFSELRTDGRERIVIDVCSTKEQLARVVRYHPMRKSYVATHPMAGTEYSGPWSALSGLFDGRACIVCDSEESFPTALKRVEELYDTLNMRLIYMNSSSHDVHAAYVSHISHITSFALALTVLEKEKDEKHIFDLASGGFSSTVRLAKSNPDMWIPILVQNRDNILRVMDTYIHKITSFRDAIAASDETKIGEMILEANKIRRIIK